VRDLNDLVSTVFSGLSPLVIEDVTDEGDRIVVGARTPSGEAVCPGCGASSGRVHGYHWRTVSDVPVDGRRVVVLVRLRRLVCPTRGCRHTFREQVPGVLERYQRCTTRLLGHVTSVVKELELLTQCGSKAAPADEHAAEPYEGFVDVVADLPADPQTPEAVQERDGLLDHPPFGAKAGSVFGAAAGDDWLDAPCPHLAAVAIVVIGRRTR
jgi:hypothetical protein